MADQERPPADYVRVNPIQELLKAAVIVTESCGDFWCEICPDEEDDRV